MKSIIRNSTGLALILLLAAACARQVEETDTQVEQRYLDAYVQINYPAEKFPDAEFKASGLFFIPGEIVYNGGPSPVVDNMLYVRYTTRRMDSTIVQTTVDSLARIMGTCSYKTYYGPQIFSMAEGASLTGLREAFSYMKPSGKARILLPSWLSSYTAGGSRNTTSTSMYDLELLRVVPDIAVFQTDSLRRFSQQHYGGVDSLKKDWYFTALTPGFDTLPAVGDTMKIRYAGYLLDGFMFDTNIRDTAVYEAGKYGERVSSSDSFDELTVIIKEDESDMGVVTGFAHALKQMRDGSEAVTFFSSDYGYGAETSGQIQPYSMLRFYMKVTIGRVATE